MLTFGTEGHSNVAKYLREMRQKAEKLLSQTKDILDTFEGANIGLPAHEVFENFNTRINYIRRQWKEFHEDLKSDGILTPDVIVAKLGTPDTPFENLTFIDGGVIARTKE